MTKIYNTTLSEDTRRNLRQNSPITESILWSKIRNRQLNGLKFRRQYSIGRFIVDFYCPEKKLAIEIDGDSHYNDGAKECDREREEYIQNFGVRFLRFTNKDITGNINGVVEAIAKIVPHPSPLLVKERV